MPSVESCSSTEVSGLQSRPDFVMVSRKGDVKTVGQIMKKKAQVDVPAQLKSA
jgi:hypothetical protein